MFYSDTVYWLVNITCDVTLNLEWTYVWNVLKAVKLSCLSCCDKIKYWWKEIYIKMHLLKLNKMSLNWSKKFIHCIYKGIFYVYCKSGFHECSPNTKDKSLFFSSLNEWILLFSLGLDFYFLFCALVHGKLIDVLQPGQTLPTHHQHHLHQLNLTVQSEKQRNV